VKFIFILDFLTNIYFLEATQFQNLILIFTGVATIITFRAKKVEKVKNASTLLLQQLKDIDFNINQIIIKIKQDRKGGVISHNLPWKEVIESSMIYNKNYWEEYKYLFLSVLTETDFETLNRFYRIVDKIKAEQILLKSLNNIHFNMLLEEYYRAGYQFINNIVLDGHAYKAGALDIEQCKTEVKRKDDLIKLYRAKVGMPGYDIELCSMKIVSEAELYQKMEKNNAINELEKISKQSIWNIKSLKEY
jgi:hypothetical protein